MPKKISSLIYCLVLICLGVVFFIIAKNFLPLDLSFLSKIKRIMHQTSLPGPLSGPKRSTRAQNLDAGKILAWTNYYRSKHNLRTLDSNPLLQKAAEDKVKDMLAQHYFDHVSPQGKKAADIVRENGYQYKIVGENLALGDFKDEKELVDSWMKSPGHRANYIRFGL